ncbi:oligopeptide/dipeptide ABC transporter ATP-binding protein [Halorubrum tebenquichense]|uniref:Peptide ABC transporter ATPase n=1 Tax=Halorubrum tebenquichense DSM 14210 TaxID=1227485 RepID=M0DPH7_9EURY|nr:oligopeptide/dipeptide ABC transporter ATP-binding protein [Halorubrum tebenquichense]ELZ36587.1 peptide ABC transporter ATPase [Halorubrum tebenquichense DSM 14210]
MTTTAHALLGLEEPTAGEVRFDGTPVSELTGADRREFRRRTQLIVQDPNDALDPRMTVGEAVAEPLRIHGLDDAERRRAVVADILERVGLSADDLNRYPHEFSGGEKQRVSIARALVVSPDLIVADEPTSALDARVRSEVLDLLDRIRREFDVALLFISHDLDVVRRSCDRVAVMYLGEIVERGATETVLADPAHPYTRVLLSSVPSLDPADRELGRPLTDTVPDPSDPPSGCRFHPRCPDVIPPDDLSVSATTWRAIAEFRFSVQAGELPEDAVGDPGTDDHGDDAEDPAAAVRRAVDLGAELPDPDAEAAVDDAARWLADGDVDAADEVLAAAFPSVCERETPAAVERPTVDEGERRKAGSVSCLRHSRESAEAVRSDGNGD